jgi:hypothetical protein
VERLAKVAQNSGMGKFRNGSQKPVASGRKKGTPNKKTLVLSESLENLKLDIPARLNELLPLLSYEKQADVLLELMSYMYPKRKPLEADGSIAVSTETTVSVQSIKALIQKPDAFSALLLIERTLRHDSSTDNE